MSATTTFQVPADDPGVVLFRLVRKARLPYSSRFVSSLVARHQQPKSLLALVQAAPHLGLSVTAARVEPAGLDDLHLPAVVHFDAAGGGFGVLERVTQAEVELWDSRSGTRRVDREVFLRSWSGIVALADRDDAQRKAEPGYRKQRLVEVLGGGLARPDLAGPPEGRVLAGTTLGLVGVLAVIAVAGHPAGTRPAAAVVTLLAGAGAVIGAVLSHATAGTTANVNVPGCPRGTLVNCESVLNSAYSRIRGVPLSDLGTAFFAAIVLLVATAAVAPRSGVTWTAVSYAYLAAVPAALLLIGVQVAMRRFCTTCLVVHALVLAGAAAGWTFAGDVPFGDALAGLAMFAFYYSAVLFAAIPFFARERRTRAMVETQRRVSASPFATLAYLATEAPAPVRGPECGIRLPGPPSPHELVLFAHPKCRQCSHTIEEISRLAAAGATEVYVAILPRYSDASERDVCAAVLAAGRAGGPGAFLRAFFYAKKHFLALLEGDPAAAIAAELSVERGALATEMEGARAMVARTDVVAADRIDGTPALFFDSRLYPYNTPVAHLETLLLKHASLLPARPGLEEREAARA